MSTVTERGERVGRDSVVLAGVAHERYYRGSTSLPAIGEQVLTGDIANALFAIGRSLSGLSYQRGASVESALARWYYEGVTFESFDSTGRDVFHLTQWTTDSALTSEVAPQAICEPVLQQLGELPVGADVERPLTGQWLNAVYSAVFTPSDVEEVDLPFDPDDYPVV